MIPAVREASLDKFDKYIATKAKDLEYRIQKDLSVKTIDVIDTGCPTLDWALAYGFGRGRTHEIYGPSMAGKCVSGDTLVPVEKKGIVRVDEIAEEVGLTSNQAPDSFVEWNASIYNDSGFSDAVGYYFSGKMPTMCVKTENGHDLSGTDTHRTLTLGWKNDAGEFTDGIARWKTLRAARPGDIVLNVFGGSVFGNRLVDLGETGIFPRYARSNAELALLGALTGVEPRSQSWALVTTSGIVRSLFKSWVQEAGLPDLTEDTPEWTRVTGITRLTDLSIPLVKLAIHPETLRAIRCASMENQRAWLSGIILTKGRWSEDHLEIELFDEETSKVFQALSENFGIRWVRYPTLHAHGEPRFKLSLRGMIDQQMAEDFLWTKEEMPREWLKKNTVDEDENHELASLTLQAARQLCLQYGRTDLATFDCDDVSKESCVVARDAVSLLAQTMDDQRLEQTLCLLASDSVTWDRVAEVSRGKSLYCWDCRVPMGSRYITNGLISHNSTLALSIAKREIATNENAFVLYLDFEESTPVDYAEAIITKPLIDKRRFRLLNPYCGEDADNLIDDLLSEKIAIVPSILFIDSLAAMRPRDSLERPLDEGQTVAAEARMNAHLSGKWTKLCSRFGMTIIVINQIRARIFTDKYEAQAAKSIRTPGIVGSEKDKTAGGTAWPFFYSHRVRLDVKKILAKEYDNPMTGEKEKKAYANKVCATIIKSKTGEPGRRGSFYIRYGQGIDVEQTLFEMAVTRKILMKNGGWYSFEYNGNEVKYQGQEAWLKALRGNAGLSAAISRRLNWDNPEEITSKTLNTYEYSLSADQEVEQVQESIGVGGDIGRVESLDSLTEKAHALGIIGQDARGMYVWNETGGASSPYEVKSLDRMNTILDDDDRMILEELVEKKLADLRGVQEEVTEEKNEENAGG